MIRAALWAVALTAAHVWAQDPSGNLTSSTGPTFLEGETVVHTVTVGLVGHTFDPSSLLANPGDKVAPSNHHIFAELTRAQVMFKFYAGNHSFIQSSYGWPCIPEAAVNGEEGIYSGQFPNATDENPLIWNLTINDTNPIWYYCGAPGSCVNYGMLGAINPANASEVEAQMDLAKQGRYVIYPGDPLPQAAAASVSAQAAIILPQYWANDTSEDNGSAGGGGGGLSGGAIAGIVIGAVAGLTIIGALIFYFGRNKGQIKALKETAKRENNTAEPSYQAPPAPPRQEMIVDGVTYVPAGTGTMSPHASYLPPYIRDGRMSPELGSKSPETISVAPYSPPLHGQQQQFFTPYNQAGEFQYQSSYTETSELGIQAPQPRHELDADSVKPERDVHETERGTGYH